MHHWRVEVCVVSGACVTMKASVRMAWGQTPFAFPRGLPRGCGSACSGKPLSPRDASDAAVISLKLSSFVSFPVAALRICLYEICTRSPHWRLRRLHVRAASNGTHPILGTLKGSPPLQGTCSTMNQRSVKILAACKLSAAPNSIQIPAVFIHKQWNKSDGSSFTCWFVLFPEQGSVAPLNFAPGVCIRLRFMAGKLLRLKWLINSISSESPLPNVVSEFCFICVLKTDIETARTLSGISY